MNPYDLLDVSPEATDDEIRAAWKSAIADLNPGDRRFRAYNQAAELLLDPQQRAAYDAEHADDEAGIEPPGTPVPVAVPVAGPADDPEAAPPLTDREATRERGRLERFRSRDQAKERREESSSAPAARPVRDAASATSVGVPTWLLIGLAVVTLLLVAATAYAWTRPSDAGVEESTRAAQSAAERAVVPILSYDAATLDEDQKAAHAYMTSDYRTEDYDPLFEVIKENAPATGTKVDAEVVASGIVRSGEDRVQILLFVNRPTTNKQQQEPVLYKDQVTVTMEKVGDDWLVDDMVTTPVGK